MSLLGLAAAKAQTTGTAASMISVQNGVFDVCQPAQTNTIRIANAGSTMSAIGFTLKLPPGAAYQPGSFSVVTGTGVATEMNIADLRNPVFSLPDIPGANYIEVSYQLKFGCEVIAFQNTQGVTRDDATITYTIAGTPYTQNLAGSSAYNVRSAALSILNVSNAAYTGNVGTSFVQSVTVVNGGLGAVSAANLNLGNLGGVTISGVSLGTLTGNVIALSGAAFGSDGQLTNNETVVVSYSVTINSCTDLQRGLTMNWGCANPSSATPQTCQTSSPPYPVGITIANNVPNLVPVITQEPVSYCPGDAPHSLTLTITNTGTGPASNLTNLDVYQSYLGLPIYDQGFYLDPASVSVSMNGVSIPTSVSVAGVKPNFLYAGTVAACFEGKPYWLRASVPANLIIQPGEKLILVFNTIQCPIYLCNSGLLGGIVSGRVSYQNQCASVNFTTPSAPEVSPAPTMLLSTFTEEIPAQVRNGQCVKINLSAGINGSPAGLRSYMDFRVALPPGFSYKSGSLAELNYNQTPASGYPKVVNDTLIVRYNTTGLGTPVFSPVLSLCVNQNPCVGGNLPLYADARASLDSSCSVLQEARQCRTPFIQVLCPNCPEGGLSVTDFFYRRVTYGLPDNDQDGKPDGNGTIDLTKVNLDRYRPGDIMRASSKGVIAPGATYSNWKFVYAEWNFGSGKWAPIGAPTVTIKRMSGPSAFSVICTGVQMQTITANSYYKLDWSLQPNCLPTGYQYEPGDSVLIDADFQLIPVTYTSGVSAYTDYGNEPIDATVRQLFYATQTANPAVNPDGKSQGPNRYQCSPINYNYHYIGINSIALFEDARVFAGSCTPLNTSVHFRTRLFGDLNGGAQYFPYEFRPCTIPDVLSVNLPAGIRYVPGANDNLWSNYTVRLGQSSSTTIPVTPIVTGNISTGQTLTYPIKSLLQSGAFFVGTEGYQMYISFQLQPSCETQDQQGGITVHCEGNYFDNSVNWQPQSFTTDSSPTPFTYSNALKPLLALTNSTPHILTTTSTASWTLSLQNQTLNAAPFTYFRSSDAGNFTAIKLIDLSTDTEVPLSASGLYELGTTNGAATRDYRITATLGQCANDSLRFEYGWNCNGYPAALTDACPKSVVVSAEGNPAGLDVTFDFQPSHSDGTVDLCKPVSVTTTINSTLIGGLKEVAYTVNLPAGMTYMPNSVSMVYPASQSVPEPLSYNPTQSGQQLQFLISQLSPTSSLSAGLTGVGDTEHKVVKILFQANTVCSFESGANITATYAGTAICGDVLPSILKLSGSMNLLGANPTSRFVVTSNTPTLQACGTPQTFSVTAQFSGSGASTADDYLVISLPENVQYVANSSSPSSVSVNGSRLTYAIPAGLTSGQTFPVRIDLAASSTLCQTTATIDIITQQVLQIACNNTVCSTPVRTGVSQQIIAVQKPTLTFTNASVSLTAVSATQESGILSLTIRNSSDPASTTFHSSAVVDIINDLNQNGVYNLGEPIVATAVVGAVIEPGATTTVSTPFSLSTGVCSLIARLNPTLNSCSCGETEARANLTRYDIGGPSGYTICTGQSVTLGKIAVPGYTYAWSGLNGASITYLSSNVVSNPTFTSDLPGTYAYELQVSRGTGCPPVSTTITVTQTALPTLSVTSATVCAGASATLTASGATSYLWSTGDTTPSLSVSAAGTYSVTGTTSNGCSATAVGMLTQTALPTLSVTSATVCAGASATLTASGATSYLWSTGDTTPSLSVSAAGTYSVTGTNGNGCSATALGTLTQNTAPIVNVTSATVCAGASATLTASGATSYLWSTGDTTPSLSVSAAGTYSVTGTTSNGCSATAVGMLTQTALPTLSVTSATVCAGASATLTVSGATSYLWSTGDTTPSLSVSAAGTYSVTGTTSNGCSATAVGMLTQTALPTLSVTSATVCAGASATLTASGATSYLWSTGDTTPSLSVSAAGTYSVTGTNGNGCSATAVGMLTQTALPTLSVTSATVCAGASATLTASGATSYLWSTGASTASIVAMANETTVYSVTGLSEMGCWAATSTTLIVNGQPQINAINQHPGCIGNVASLTVDAASTGALEYSFNGGAFTGMNSFTLNAPDNTVVKVVVRTRGSSCIATDSIVVNCACQKPASLTFVQSSLQTCLGSPISFTAGVSGASSATLSTNGTGALSSSLITGIQTISYTPSLADATLGSITLTLSSADPDGAGSCQSSQLSRVLVVNSLPLAGVNSATLCAGQSAILTASGGDTYRWSTGATTQSISASVAGDYSVTVTTAGGCSATAVGTVTVNPTVVAGINGNLTLCQGMSTTLTATGGVSYLWSTGETTASIVVNAVGSYSVTVLSATGCSATASARVVACPACSTSIKVTAGNCSTATNTYSATAVIHLINPTQGTLTVTDGTQSLTFVTTAVDSVVYTAVFNDLISDGSSHILTATASGCSPTSIAYTAPGSCTQPSGTQLDLQKLVNKSSVNRGEGITYTLVLTNIGKASASNVQVRDSTSAGLRIVSGSATVPIGTTFTTGTPVSTWLVGTIAPAQSLSLTFQAIADSTGVLYNRASIPGDTVTVCTTVPIRYCMKQLYTVHLAAPGGHTNYQWFKNGALISGATTNHLDVSTPGTYSFSSSNGGGQCPFIIEEDSLPVFKAQAIPVTCVGSMEQSDGRIQLSTFQVGNTYQYSVGTSFNPAAPLSGAPRLIPNNGLIAGNLSNPTTATAYTIRVYNGAGCYEDSTVVLLPTVCSCPPAPCVPIEITKIR